VAGVWEHFHHEADIGVRGFGGSVEEAFEAAAVGLTAVICTPEDVTAKDRVQIHCEAPDIELLFADWLNAIIYEMATRSMLFRRFGVRIKDNRLDARAWGQKVDVEKHAPAVEVKAATYTQLKVSCDDNGRWVAQCVVDV